MTDRGQASLPPLAIALLSLTGATVLALTLASGALAGADRAPDERRTAVALADRLVAADSQLTERANVLDRTRLEAFDGEQLVDDFPVTDGADVEVRVGDDVVARTSETVRGGTIRRLVLVAETDERTVSPSLGFADAVTLPRRTDHLELSLAPAPDTRIETVRANHRVVLHDPDGLRGSFDVSLSARQNTRLAFEANRSLADGSVSLTIPVERTTKATLAVTVDA
jgi:hypothetical protein